MAVDSLAPTSDARNGLNAPNGQTNLQNVASATTPAAPPDAAALLAALAGFGQNAQATTIPAAPPAMPFAQNVAPVPPPSFLPPPPPAVSNGQPPAVPSGVSIYAAPILQALQAGQLQPEQAFQLISLLNAQQNSGVQFPPPQPVVTQAPSVPQNGTQERFEPNGNRFRDRSRSPDMNSRRRSPARRSPPNRRDSPTYGVYDPNASADGSAGGRHDRGRGRGRNKSGRNDRNEFRQRTPPPQRRQPSPVGNGARNAGSKFLDWEPTLPREHIKVLSRTLFIGGASGTEGEIRSIFSRFGKVQTCIVNQDKRHAFVKMLNRPDAVAAKEGMDAIQDPSAMAKARQVR